MVFFRLPEGALRVPERALPQESRQDATSRCFNMAALSVSIGELEDPEINVYHCSFTNWDAGGCSMANCGSSPRTIATSSQLSWRGQRWQSL
jgi:hypothetical protein